MNLFCLDLKQKFYDLQKQHSPEPREFFAHFTSVVVRAVSLLFSSLLLIAFFDSNAFHFILRFENLGHECDFYDARYRYEHSFREKIDRKLNCYFLFVRSSGRDFEGSLEGRRFDLI